tara:strand:- start:2179 stop:3162 length:984 start_codon:yes stop_codon:yes gene_type:complete
MPDTEEKKENMVDIDNSGPSTEIEIDSPETTEDTKNEKIETVNEDNNKSDDTLEKSSESVDVQSEPEPKEQDQKLDELSEGVKKRINKLTKKWREAERQKDAAVQYAEGVEAKRKAWETRYAKLDSTYLKDSEVRIKSQLDAVKGKLGAAIESGDTAKQVEAQAELSALTGDFSRITNDLSRRKPLQDGPATPAYSQQPPAQTPSLPQVDEKAEDWAEKNKWFGKDRAMTFTAFEIHKDLVEKEGFDPQSQEYYAEVDKRIRVDFPNRFDNNESRSTKPAQTVASVRRGVKPGRKSVKLTPSEITIARKLGVPPEEYARQKLNMKEV